jgi:hypothetical protein
MGNTTTNTIKTIAGAVNIGSQNDDYLDDRLPEGDKYYGFINVIFDILTYYTGL